MLRKFSKEFSNIPSFFTVRVPLLLRRLKTTNIEMKVFQLHRKRTQTVHKTVQTHPKSKTASINSLKEINYKTITGKICRVTENETTTKLAIHEVFKRAQIPKTNNLDDVI